MRNLLGVVIVGIVVGVATGARADVSIDLKAKDPVAALPAVSLFGEAPSRVIVAVREGFLNDVLAAAKTAAVPASVLGVSGGERLVIERAGRAIIDVKLTALRAARDACLAPIVGE